jgi:ribonuclease BN (tRNA processing enzyme)
MDLNLTVLGCSGSYPGAECPCSGYLVQYGSTAVAVDLGPGCLSNLQRHIELPALRGVVLSHCHPDHWVDISGLHVALKHRFAAEGLPIYGTAANREMASLITGSFEPTFTWSDTGDEDVFVIGDLRFTMSATDHYVETHAMRIDDPEGRSIVYSADTGPEWSISKLGSGIDLALLEATYGTDAERGDLLHLSASDAGAMARSVSARRLVLTHFWPDTDLDVHARNGAEAYGAPVTIASPNERYLL